MSNIEEENVVIDKDNKEDIIKSIMELIKSSYDNFFQEERDRVLNELMGYNRIEVPSLDESLNLDDIELSLKEKINRQRKIIDGLFHTVVGQLLSKEQLIEYVKKCVEILFKLEIRYYKLDTGNRHPNIELQFFADKRAAPGYFRKRNEILNIPYTININEEFDFDDLFSEKVGARIFACRDILLTLFHEFKHLRQRLAIDTGICSYYNLRNAKEELVHSNNIKSFYKYNHNRYAMEADADYSSFESLVHNGNKDSDITSLLELRRAQREVSFILTDKGIVNRDKYIDEQTDKIMESMGILVFVDGEKLLKYEYDSNCNPISFSDLIKNNGRTIMVNSFLIPSMGVEVSKPIEKDIKSLYFYLFNKKILSGDKIELIEAILEHGEDKILELLNELYIYNRNERNRKNKLVKESTDYFLKNNPYVGLRFEMNNGYIADPKKQFKAAISTEDFVTHQLGIKNEDPRIVEFLNHDNFKEMLPIQGYFVDNSGKKVSIKDYVHNILIPALKKIEIDPDKDFIAKYTEAYYGSIDEYFITGAEMSSNYAYTQINKDYQEQMAAIEEYRKLIESKLYKQYNHTLLSNMKSVIDIVKHEKLPKGFSTETTNGVMKTYEEQRELYQTLIEASKVLSKDMLLNPEGMNYHKKLLSNPSFDALGKVLNAFINNLEMTKENEDISL